MLGRERKESPHFLGNQIKIALKCASCSLKQSNLGGWGAQRKDGGTDRGQEQERIKK